MIENRLAAFLLGSSALLLGGTAYLLRTDHPPAFAAEIPGRHASSDPGPSFAISTLAPTARVLAALPTTSHATEISSGIPAHRESFAAAISAPPPHASYEDESTFTEDLSSTSVADEKPFAPAPINARANGNSFVFRGMRVAVAERLAENRNDRPALGIDVTPENNEAQSNLLSEADLTSAAAEPSIDDSSNSKPEAGKGDPPDDSAEPAGSPTVRRSRLQVFTAEENAFRARWGWEAFDLMRREAARGAATP